MKAGSSPASKAVTETPFFAFFQVVSEKVVNVDNALSAKDIDKCFISKLEYKKSEEQDFGHMIVSTNEYVDILAPILAEINPFCTYKIPVTNCYVRRNRQKENTAVQVISAKLACR